MNKKLIPTTIVSENALVHFKVAIYRNIKGAGAGAKIRKKGGAGAEIK